MALRLSYWGHPSGPGMDRIYVNGLAAKGRIYLHQARGMGIAVAGDEVSAGARQSLLAEILASLGINGALPNTEIWEALQGLCAKPRAGSVPARTAQVHPVPAAITGLAEQLDVATIKVPKPITIRVDHREPEEVIRELRRAQNTTIEICTLELGDYSVNDKLFIERKTVSDFEASIIDSKRLFDQSERIKMEPASIGVVLLEGDWTRAQRMLPQQVIGAMSFLGAIQGISVWQTTGPVCTAYTIVKLATHLCNGLGYELGLRQHKPQSLLDAQSYVLEGCPGINAELARRLIRHFGSVAAVAKASEQDLRTVEGIGPKKAKRIAEVLGG